MLPFCGKSCVIGRTRGSLGSGNLTASSAKAGAAISDKPASPICRRAARRDSARTSSVFAVRRLALVPTDEMPGSYLGWIIEALLSNTSTRAYGRSLSSVQQITFLVSIDFAYGYRTQLLLGRRRR